jgi:hypothetical protein
MKGVPSLTSTDKSVCATLIPRYQQVVLQVRASVAQTLLSVLWQDAVPEVANPGDCYVAEIAMSSRRLRIAA